MSKSTLYAPALPVDSWRITETAPFGPGQFQNETLFCVGNGYIGMRGSHEEGAAKLEGNYLNGFHDTEAIQYPENAFGLARTNQFMLNVPNAKRIDLEVDGVAVTLADAKEYQRTLDLRTGVVERKAVWKKAKTVQLIVETRRLASLRHKHIAAIEYAVTLPAGGKLRLVSHIDDATTNMQAGDDPRVGSAIEGPSLLTQQRRHDGDIYVVEQRTRHSGLQLVSGILNAAGRDLQPVPGGHQLEADVAPGERIVLVKYIAYASSRDGVDPAGCVQSALVEAAAAGFDALVAVQREELDAYWAAADVEIAGDDALQQGVRFNQFHLLQSAGHDGKTNISAKGVTGEGYEGHYFWDTEIYVLPYFAFTRPAVARALLAYRCSTLPNARQRAREMGHEKGALYPWRTIAGDECSAYFPAGSAQYHINADIAYALKLYLEASGDDAFLLEGAAEMLLDTARIWLGLGHYDRDGRFCINVVTGPDEYTALVNNNFYTNAMARMHLRFASEVARRLQREHPQAFARIAAALTWSPEEALAWNKAADAMVLPYDKRLAIHAQDDSFLSKKVWDFDGTPKDKYPLLLHFHPMVIYRHQVCKQADVVLALLLLSGEFDIDDKRRDFDYYESVTTHDSSLSTCIFSIIANEVGYHDKAYRYFMETARLDLDNTHGNTEYGVHTAAMAGTWLGVAYGFGGMRLVDGVARFAPVLPQQWQHYSFRVQLRGARLQLRIADGQVEYSLLEGAALRFFHHGWALELDAATPSVTVDL